MTAFQMWLRVASSPRRSATVRQHLFDTARPARSDNHINLISYVVSEMFRFAAAEGLWPSDKLGMLFETAQVRFGAKDRGPDATHTRWSSVDGIDFGHDQRAAEMRLPTVSKTNTTLPHHIIV
jgi:hypothetical protein